MSEPSGKVTFELLPADHRFDRGDSDPRFGNGRARPIKERPWRLLITLLAGGRAHAASRARSDRRDSKDRRDTVSDLGSGACTP
jgi:hypothetical protein